MKIGSQRVGVVKTVNPGLLRNQYPHRTRTVLQVVVGTVEG